MPRKIINYEILEGHSVEKLRKEVRIMIDETDWQPLGGHVETYGDEQFFYSQTMVRYDNA